MRLGHFHLLIPDNCSCNDITDDICPLVNDLIESVIELFFKLAVVHGHVRGHRLRRLTTTTGWVFHSHSEAGECAVTIARIKAQH